MDSVLVLQADNRYNPAMQRRPEPELMNEPAQVRAYAEADFDAAHASFIDLFQDKFPHQDFHGEVLELGCGPADISRRFALAWPDAILHAVDGAPAMLQAAADLNRQQGLDERIRLIESRLPGLQLPQQHYHTLISNSLLHHLPDPHALWDTIKLHAKPFARVFIMDLMRPDTEQMASALVAQYAADEAAILREDFYHSLLAAFTPAEVQAQLDEHSLSQLTVDVVSDRHMIIYGTL